MMNSETITKTVVFLCIAILEAIKNCRASEPIIYCSEFMKQIEQNFTNCRKFKDNERYPWK